MRIRRKKKGKSLHRRQNKTRHGKRGGMNEAATPTDSAQAISNMLDPEILNTDPENLSPEQSAAIKNGAKRGIEELVALNGSNLATSKRMTEYDRQKQAAIKANTEKQEELRQKFDEVTGQEDKYVKSITQAFIDGDRDSHGDYDTDYQKRHMQARSMFDGFKHKKERVEKSKYNEFISIGASTNIEEYEAIIKTIYDSLAVILSIFMNKRREVIKKERQKTATTNHGSSVETGEPALPRRPSVTVNPGDDDISIRIQGHYEDVVEIMKQKGSIHSSELQSKIHDCNSLINNINDTTTKKNLTTITYELELLNILIETKQNTDTDVLDKFNAILKKLKDFPEKTYKRIVNPEEELHLDSGSGDLDTNSIENIKMLNDTNTDIKTFINENNMMSVIYRQKLLEMKNIIGDENKYGSLNMEIIKDPKKYDEFEFMPNHDGAKQPEAPPSAGRDLDDKNHNRHVNIKIQGKEIEFGTKQPEGIEFEDNTTELTVETTDSKDKGFIKIRINPDNIDNNKDTYYIKTRE